MKVAVVCISDTSYADADKDASGLLLKSLLIKKFPQILELKYTILPDDQHLIEMHLSHLADENAFDLILTTGGTGFTARDVTPEATEAVIDRKALGVSTALLMNSLTKTPFAMLSRGICGIRKCTMIVNLPGSPKAVSECFDILIDVIPHAIDQLRGHTVKVKQEHLDMQHQEAVVDTNSLSGSIHGETSTSRHHHHHHHHCNDNHQHQHDHHNHTSSLVNETRVAERARKSPHAMISVEGALALVLEHCSSTSTETVSYTEALGRVLSSDVFANDPVPPFRASIKDGYAVRSADGPGFRNIVDVLSAGDSTHVELEEGCAARVNTGCPVPDSADAVVQVEDTRLIKSSPDMTQEVVVEMLFPMTPGQDIRPVGSDVAQGDKVLNSGTLLGPAEIGILATVGAVQVDVYKLPVIGVASTGNELVDPELRIPRWKIRDSNRAALLSLFKRHGFPTRDYGIIPDSANQLCDGLSKAVSECDIVVTTGGVSMGEKDLVRQVLTTDFNAKLHFAQVFMKPGKPTSFLTIPNKNKADTLFFGLPGNPVSALVTANLYVIPASRKSAGWLNPQNARIFVKLGQSLKLDPRPEYHRCVLEWSTSDASELPVAWSTGSQQSSRLLSCLQANGLLVLPPSSDAATELPVGTPVPCLMLPF